MISFETLNTKPWSLCRSLKTLQSDINFDWSMEVYRDLWRSMKVYGRLLRSTEVFERLISIVFVFFGFITALILVDL